jgi:hypothetical protein
LPVANFEIAAQPAEPTDGDKLEPKICAAQVGPIPTLAKTSGWTVLLIGRSGRGPLTDARKFLPFALRGRDDLGFYTPGVSEGYLQMAWFATSDDPYWSLTSYDAAGSLNTAEFGGFGEGSPRDQRWHLYALTSSGGTTPTLTGYVDGTPVVSTTLGVGEMAHFNSISAGNMSYIPDGTDTDADGIPDSDFLLAIDPRHEFGRLGIINGTALNNNQLADLYAAIITATVGDGDTVEERLERWFDYAGFPAGSLTVTSPGTAPLTPQEVSGTSPLQLLQDVANTDGGVLFDSPSGTNTTYYGRSVRLTATTSVTVSAATQNIESGLSTPADLSALVNSVTVSAADGSAKVTRADAASIALYGYSGEEQTLFTNSAARADWRLHTSAIPVPRAPAVSFQLSALPDSRQDELLSLGMWSILGLTALPSAVNGIPTRFFIEGGTETWSHQSCVLSFNVTDASPELEVGVYDSGLFDNATFG